VTERPQRSVNLGAAYSTDLGGSVTASWTHHDLFGNGETLALSAAATELGGTAALQPGYNVSAVLTLPDWGHRDQSLSFNATALKEYLQAYDRTAYLAGTTLSRKLDPDLTVSAGLEGEEAHIVQEEVGREYTLAQVPLVASYDTTHDPLNPTHGLRAGLNITPTESFSNRSATFVIAQASASTYLDVFGDGRTVVAARALVGGVEGATTFDIPPDQRFYGGGGGTIRGFRFQSVGPKFADANPVGGTSVDVGSLELRQRFLANYGAVAFVDAGQVGSNGVPFEGNVAVGAGVGARYYTSFGPIRLDFALPVTRLPGGDAFEVYIGIGQAF
jgi:translocation and assembly module TamA